MAIRRRYPNQDARAHPHPAFQTQEARPWPIFAKALKALVAEIATSRMAFWCVRFNHCSKTQRRPTVAAFTQRGRNIGYTGRFF